jgi:hypothetical protein
MKKTLMFAAALAAGGLTSLSFANLNSADAQPLEACCANCSYCEGDDCCDDCLDCECDLGGPCVCADVCCKPATECTADCCVEN